MQKSLSIIEPRDLFIKITIIKLKFRRARLTLRKLNDIIELKIWNSFTNFKCKIRNKNVLFIQFYASRTNFHFVKKFFFAINVETVFKSEPKLNFNTNVSNCRAWKIKIYVFFRFALIIKTNRKKNEKCPIDLIAIYWTLQCKKYRPDRLKPSERPRVDRSNRKMSRTK